MSNQREQYHSNMPKHHVNKDEEDSTNHYINADSGDLRAWEYLTNRYDNARWMDDSTIVTAQDIPLTDTVVVSINPSTSTLGLAEMGNVQQSRTETIPSATEGRNSMLNSASSPDLSLYHRDYRFQHFPSIRNQHAYFQQHLAVGMFSTDVPPQQASPTPSNPTRPWSHPMRMNQMDHTPAITGATTPFTMFQSQSHSNRQWVASSQQPLFCSEDDTTITAQSTCLHQPWRLQQQNELLTEETPPQQHEQIDIEPLPLYASRIHDRLTLAEAPIQTTDHVFPSSLWKNDFEPKPVHPGHMESIHANTDTTIRASEKSSVSTYSKKRSPWDYSSNATSVTNHSGDDIVCEKSRQPSSLLSNRIKDVNTVMSESHMLGEDTSGRINDDNTSSDEEVYDLKLPSFVHQILPPYQQQNNIQLLLKPFTSYNYFYRDERENIVQNFTKEDDPLPPPVSDFTRTKMDALLHEHWYVDPLKRKRVHKKSHGIVSFEQLSKTIAERWRSLSDEGRKFYQHVSFLDNVYYHKEFAKIEQSKSTSTVHKGNDACLL
jgi:hypothetical protein